MPDYSGCERGLYVMRQEHVRLVEEDNTIYEIDLDCIKRKKQAEEHRNKELEKKTDCMEKDKKR